MADTTWIGGDSGNENDWDTAANWSDGVPGASDTAFIVSGSVDIAGGIPTAGTITRLVVGPHYGGTIGSAATELQISVSVEMDYSGRGAISHLQGTYPTLTVQDTSSGSSALNLYSTTITTLRVVGGRGTINIDGSSTISSLIEQIGAEGITTVLADGVTLTGCTLTMDSGKVTMNEGVPNISVFGGELESTIPTADTDTITLLEVYAGQVRFKTAGASTITQLTMYGGRFYSTESTAPSFTITDCLLHEGAVLDERSGLRNITFTNAVQMEGGEIKYDIGREITLT